MRDPVRIAFDVGGVLSKYPEVFRPLLETMNRSESMAVFIISDMHPVDKIVDMLNRNGFGFLANHHQVHSADYRAHGESCKARLCEELVIDILVDDFIGYVADPGLPLVRLLVMPDSKFPYYADDWQTDGTEGDFGRRRNPAGSKRPPEDR